MRRNRVQESLAKRVHNQPRLRTVPCQHRVLGEPATATNGEACVLPTHAPIRRALEQTDPPGVNDGVDFTVMAVPNANKLVLHPRKSGVGPRSPNFFFVFLQLYLGSSHCPNACFWQTPIRPGTKCYVLHPDYGHHVVGEAKAGVNNKSRSLQKSLVKRAKDGQQFILFKKVYRHGTPLIFPNDPHIAPNQTCDGVVLSAGRTGQWVRWWCRYLIDMSTINP